MGWRRGGRAAAVLGIVAALAAGVPAAEESSLAYHAVVRNGGVMGSGFLIGEGLAVTNRHVVAGLRPGGAVWLFAGGRSVAARLAAVSPHMDLAVLRLAPGFLPVVAGEDAPGRAGEAARAACVDASGGPEAGSRLELRGAVLTTGAELATFGPGLIVALPGARPGCSGGPLLDAGARLLGMVTAIRPASGTADPAAGGAGGEAPAMEAFALGAPAIRAEVARLLGGRVSLGRVARRRGAASRRG
jgi:S1-C subfamily serine protease